MLKIKLIIFILFFLSFPKLISNFDSNFDLYYTSLYFFNMEKTTKFRKETPNGPFNLYDSKSKHPVKAALDAFKFLNTIPINNLSLSNLLKAERILLEDENINFRSIFAIYLPDQQRPMGDLKENKMITCDKQNSCYYSLPSRFINFKDLLSKEKITFYESLSKKNIDETFLNESLIQEMIMDLTQNLLSNIKQVLGKCEDEKQIIKTVAKFYKLFLSIHPFTDGNGRLARLIVARLFNSYKMVPPLYIRPNIDIELSDQELETLFVKGYELSKMFHQKFTL